MSIADLLLFVAGVGTGLLSGLFGVGGGFILVPCLSVLGWPMSHAVGTSLLYIVVTALGTSIARARRRGLNYAIIMQMALPAATLAPAGVWLSVILPEYWLQLLFSALLLLVAWQTQTSAHPPHADTESKHPSRRWAIALGAFTGILSGLFGVGGGVILVPGQVMIFRLTMVEAVANSLAVISLTGFSGVAAHAWAGHLDWHAALWLIPGGLIGAHLGSRLLARLSPHHLRHGFSALLVILAIYGALRALLS